MKRNKLKDVQDSTSSLTTDLLCLDNDSENTFSIDVAIVTKNNEGQWLRLIHKKTGYFSNDEWFWNIAKNSNNIKQKADDIKINNLWNEVRNVYLIKKNYYLKNNDYNHSSFNCYIESVNEVYDKYFR